MQINNDEKGRDLTKKLKANLPIKPFPTKTNSLAGNPK